MFRNDRYKWVLLWTWFITLFVESDWIKWQIIIDENDVFTREGMDWRWTLKRMSDDIAYPLLLRDLIHDQRKKLFTLVKLNLTLLF